MKHWKQSWAGYIKLLSVLYDQTLACHTLRNNDADTQLSATKFYNFKMRQILSIFGS